MITRLLPAELQGTVRKVRLLAILDSCQRAGLAPTNISVIHSIAYLADALAPVWHLPILDGQILKRSRRPFFPTLQADLDLLVGQGLVEVKRFSYVNDVQNDSWHLDADYRFVEEPCRRVLDRARQFEEQAVKLDFVREVVFAASGLGPSGIADIGLLDAAYSDPFVDLGEVIDIDEGSGMTNATAGVALRFAELTSDTRDLSDSEMVHLYIRHLYLRMRAA